MWQYYTTMWSWNYLDTLFVIRVVMSLLDLLLFSHIYTHLWMLFLITFYFPIFSDHGKYLTFTTTCFFIGCISGCFIVSQLKRCIYIVDFQGKVITITLFQKVSERVWKSPKENCFIYIYMCVFEWKPKYCLVVWNLTSHILVLRNSLQF
jgi:hypothetical protein